MVLPQGFLLHLCCQMFQQAHKEVALPIMEQWEVQLTTFLQWLLVLQRMPSWLIWQL